MVKLVPLAGVLAFAVVLAAGCGGGGVDPAKVEAAAQATPLIDQANNIRATLAC